MVAKKNSTAKAAGCQPDEKKARLELIKSALDMFLCYNACGPVDLVEYALSKRAEEMGIDDDVLHRIVFDACDYMGVLDDEGARHTFDYAEALSELSHLLIDAATVGKGKKAAAAATLDALEAAAWGDD